MTQEMNCSRFMDLLDELGSSGADSELPEGLLRHAEHCPDCAMLLRLHKHIDFAAGYDLEEDVPDHHVDEMWKRVNADLTAGPAVQPEQRIHTRNPWYVRPWLTTALAAALVVCFFGSGWLLGQNRLLQARLHRIDSRPQENARAAEHLDDRQGGHGAAAFGLRLAAGNTRPEEITAGQLLVILRQLPPERVVMNDREVGRLLEARALNRISMKWPEIESSDGLQAGEALLILESLDLDPETLISRGRLAALSDGVLEY